MTRRCLFCSRELRRDPRARYCELACKRAADGIAMALRRAGAVLAEDPAADVVSPFKVALTTAREATDRQPGLFGGGDP